MGRSRPDLAPVTFGEAIACVVEECGDVLKAIGKLERFGERPTDPRTGIRYNNVADLLKEMDDLHVAMAEVRNRLRLSSASPADGLAYLATPYSRFPAGIEQAFVAAATLAAKLLQAGVKVYSPIAHTHPLAVHGKIDPFDHAIWMPFDQAMMKVCDTLIVAHLETWELSKGIAMEVESFGTRGLPIFDLDPDTLKMTRRKNWREAT